MTVSATQLKENVVIKIALIYELKRLLTFYSDFVSGFFDVKQIKVRPFLYSMFYLLPETYGLYTYQCKGTTINARTLFNHI